MINPDGVVSGNYRSNLQGKDMNRHFFADSDTESHKHRMFEAEMLKDFLKKQFDRNQTGHFKMFLDIHAHSTLPSIFIYAPLDEQMSFRETEHV